MMQCTQKGHHIVISKLSSTCNNIYHEIISATTSGADPMTTQSHTSPLEFPNKKNVDKNQHYSSWLAFIPSFHHDCYYNGQTAIPLLGNDNDTPVTAKADADADTDTDTAAVQRLLSHLGHVKEQMGSLAHIVSEMKQQSTLGIRTTPENEFRRASRNLHVNPFEYLSIDLDGNPLVSRSALKLANMDALVDFCLCCTCTGKNSVNPNSNSSDNSSSSNSSSSSDNNNFLFVDLCGAPGGFSQYILFRRMKHQQLQQQQQRTTDTETDAESGTLVEHPIGYGMSLGGENCDGRGIEWDKTLERGKEQPFKVHFGADGTGDIYNWDNVLSLQHTISRDWNRRSRVDLVVADGGFDAQRDSEDQEGLATNLVICQVAAAFQLLERGGNFVLKMFGFQSLAMRYVMEALVEQFETVKIVKPVASRPASAERYVIAMGFRQCGKWNHHDDAATRDLDALTRWAFEWRRDGLLMGKQQQIRRRRIKNVQELEEETTNRSVLDQSLDRFDWDMASLNIDACEKILHCLQEQQQRFTMYHGSRKTKKAKIKHTVVVDEPNIDVEHIRKLWNL